MDDRSPKERHFERRQRAGQARPASTQRGRTPSAALGFFKQDLPEDVREYATRLSRRLKKRGPAWI